VAVGLFVAHALLEHGADIGSAPGVTGVYGLLAVTWLGSLAVNRLYQARCVERVGEETRRLLVAGAMSIGVMLAVGYIADTTQPTRSWVIGVFAVVTMALLIDRTIARALFAHLRSAGEITRRVAIIGTDDRASALAHSLADDPRLGYTVAGFVGPVPSTHDGECRYLGGLEQVPGVLVANGCIGGIVSVASLRQDQVNMITRRLVERGLHAELSTNLRDIDLTRIRLQSIDGQVLLYIEPARRNGWRAMLKRLLDLTVAVVVMILALPIMLIAAVLVKFDSPGPVLFRQRRVGRNGDPFEMLKLRTMCVDAELQQDELLPLNEAGGPMFKIKDDPRLTRVGRWLRRLSIDELPQLWNVIRGEMSVVGPRPALPHEVAEWDRDLYQRLTVPPGITGMWQVSGRSDATFDQYRRLDLYYVDNWSLLHDLQVMAKTIWVVLTARGAS
jgi:exopolysaccharide biosynthesis polyprenyl glycosylphosphotransferase